MIFYIGYKLKLRKEMSEKLDEKMNDALSKYYMSSQDQNNYKGAMIKNENSNTSTITQDCIEV